MSEAWVIRPPRLEDARAFVRAHEAAWDAVGIADQLLAELVPEEQRVRLFEDSLAKLSDDAQVWAAEQDGTIVGFAACTREGDTAELRNLYVVPEAWGAGVARALHETALEWMRDRAQQAVLWVAEANARARRFYEREGWAADDEVRPSPLGPRERRFSRTL